VQLCVYVYICTCACMLFEGRALCRACRSVLDGKEPSTKVIAKWAFVSTKNYRVQVSVCSTTRILMRAIPQAHIGRRALTSSRQLATELGATAIKSQFLSKYIGNLGISGNFELNFGDPLPDLEQGRRSRKVSKKRFLGSALRGR
jgi:hypothetical protein